MGILIALVLFGLLFVAAFPFMVWYVAAAMRRKTKEEQARRPEILDGAFDGREAVVYQRNSLAGLSHAEVVEGALARGYELVSATPDGQYAENLTFRART